MSGWVLITGAAQRIGRVIALELAAAGYDIIVHYNKSQDEAAKTAHAIEALSGKVCLAELDLANATLVEQLIPSLVKELGPLAGLINNASLFVPDKMQPGSAAHHAINTAAPRLLSVAFHKQVPRKQTGVIVNLLDAHPTGPEFTLYNASKIALAEITAEMAKDFAPAVRVNGVALGPILKTPRQSDAHFQKLVKQTPLGRAIGPQSVAAAVRFLIESDAITGAILPVDGGMHLAVAKN